jgi:hypothetical protein
MNIQEQIEQIQKTLDELKQEVERESEVWKPNEGDTFWYINILGNVLKDQYGDIKEWELEQLLIGNIYRTQEQAEYARDFGWYAKLKAQLRIENYIKENGLEFETDWSDGDQYKWYVVYNHLRGWYQHECDEEQQFQFAFYLKTSEHAQQVIDNCKDDLDILFGLKK